MRFLARYDGEVSEPLVGRQGSRVSMRVARGSASLLPSHGRGLWPRDMLKKVSRGLPGERGHLSSCIWNLGVFPDDARASHCPFVLTSFTGWTSERCPGIGFFSRGDREIGVLRNVEAPTRPRLECRRETGLILRCDRKVGNPFQTKQGSRPSCPDQEGRRGSEEVLPENFGVPLEGDRDVGALCGSHQG